MRFLSLARLALPLAVFSSTLVAAPLQDGDIGHPKVPGSATQTDGAIAMTAGGKDVWGVSDQFHFAYQKRTGDFDIAVRVERLSPAQLYSRTGIMARESLAPNSPHVFFIVFSDNSPRHNNNTGYELQFRPTAGGKSQAVYPAGADQSPFLVSYPQTWLRLVRHGDEFTAYAGHDGKHWTKYGTQSVPLPAELYLGLALTAHDGSKTASASFEDFGDVR